jgi:hypothetical protein
MKRLMFFLMLWTFLVSSSCKKEPPLEFPYGVPMTFKLRLLDANGKETSEFKQGENFVLSFLITNHATNKWVINDETFFGNSNFFRVFKVVSPTDSLDKGQPYDTNVNCSGAELIIKPEETVEFKRDWLSDKIFGKGCIRGIKQPALEIGQYKTGFSTRFSFFEGDSFRVSSRVRFDYDFKIK